MLNYISRIAILTKSENIVITEMRNMISELKGYAFDKFFSIFVKR